MFSVLFVPAAFFAGAQETASRYFQRVSERYNGIEDYTADLVITKGGRKQTAVVWYKSPNLLRLDFSDPDGMVMSVDGELLQFHVPSQRVTFSQVLRDRDQLALAAGARGLELMSKYYTPSYLSSSEGSTPVPLYPGSSEMVVKLRMFWKTNNEGFSELRLAIDSDLKVRRITGITTTGREIMFDFLNMRINEGIPDSRFQYESPATSNTLENFLFNPGS